MKATDNKKIVKLEQQMRENAITITSKTMDIKKINPDSAKKSLQGYHSILK
jgi:hypothetical protein